MRITRKLLAGWALTLIVTSSSLFGAVEKDNLYIVLLEEKSLAESVMEWAPEASPAEWRALLRSPRARDYMFRSATLKEGRFGRLLGRLQTTGPTRDLPRLLDQGIVVLNYMLVEGELDQVQALAGEVAVAGVYPVEERFPMTDSMPELVRATEAWEVLGGIENAGAGIKIGFIDSGVNIEHPMFNDEELEPPDGFPLGGFAGQTNQKVIVARNYVLEFPYGLRPQPIQDPRDELGHGSRVAGVAAGAVTETLIGTLRGIAPKAFIGIYKVFGDPGINGTTTNAAVLAAIEDAVADGMDVINLSLGGPARNPNGDPEQIAIANASALGAVFVIAAGNRGSQGAGSVTSPGTSPEALTVGSTSHNRVLLPRIELMSNDVVLPPELQVVPYQPGNGSTITELTGPLLLTHIAHLDPSQEGCLAPPVGSLQGMVALVKRGGCLFIEKAENILGTAQAAGLLVYNNAAGRPISMDFSGEQVGAPAVMIDQERGRALSLLLRNGNLAKAGLGPSQNAVEVSLIFYPENDQSSFAAFPLIPDDLSSFSGRGPSFDQIKPDLVSAGEAVLSADRCRPNFNDCGISYSNPASTQGTSFSTPAVSGAAALIRQQYPSWPSSWIRSAIVNTTLKTVMNNGEAATVNQAGNGRLDVLAAIQTPAVLEPLSLSFGSQGSSPQSSRDFLLTNVSNQSQSFHFSTKEDVNDAELEFFIDPAMATLMPGESITATLSYDAGSNLGSGFFEGSVGIEAQSLTPAGPSSTTENLSISFWGRVTFVIGGRTLEVSQAGSSEFTDLSSALAAALPQDTIEVLDSATYPENILIATDGNGIPLHGLTLRAGPGARPIIQGDGSGVTLEVRGISNLTIQGFEFRGGNGLMELQDSNGILQDNRLDGSTAESAGTLLALSNSHFHIFGNELLGASSTALGLFNTSSALIQRNRIGSPSQPSGQHGFFAGTQSSASLFENVIDSSGASAVGQSVRISSASSLLRANRIVRGAGPVADGLLVQGPGASAELHANVISDQSQLGIFVLNSAQLESVADRIFDNARGGVRLEAQARARIRRAQFFRNDLAASIEDAQLEVSDSLIAGSSLGFELVSGSLNLRRSTVFGHTGAGINTLSGTLLADHNIFSENGGGDVVGGGAEDLFFNLTDGLSAAGSNVQGQARFADPSSFDFSLTAQSDAIDRGDPAVCCLEGDLFSHRRVTDGNADGVAVLDMGAVEFASPSAPSLIAPVLVPPGEAFVGLALANAGAQVPADPEALGDEESVARVVLQAYDSAGQAVGEAIEDRISSATQSAFLIGDRFPATASWIQIRPSQPDLVSFTLVGANDLNFMDGSQLAPAVDDVLILPEVEADNGLRTALYVVNPETQSQELSVTLRRPAGPDLNALVQLPAMGSTVIDVAETFGPASEGYLMLQGERPLFAMEIFGDEDSRGGLLAMPQSSASDRLFGAQLASTPAIDTRINLINVGAATTTVLTLRDEAGNEIASAQRMLSAGGQLSIQAADLFELEGQEVDGWLEVSTEAGQLLGNVVFGDPSGRSKAALPLQSVGAREFLLSQIAESSDIFTGVTLLNAELGTALISIEAFDPQGTLLGRSFQSLLSREKRAFLLRELMPDIGDQSGGFLRVRSTHRILGFELFGNQDLRFLSAVPQQKVVE